MVNSEQELNQMLDDYYALRSWNLASGIPDTRELRRLGLEEVAVELENLQRDTQ
jgi:aldehyde:ferredoxin oxidoreductase